MGEYVSIAGMGEVPPGNGLGVEINARSISIFNIDGAFFALNNCDPVESKLERNS